MTYGNRRNVDNLWGTRKRTHGKLACGHTSFENPEALTRELMGSQSALRYTLRRHGLTRELHGSHPSPSLCFYCRLIPLTLTNSFHAYTMSLAFPEGSTQAFIRASSRGGIGSDIVWSRIEHRTIKCNSTLYIWWSVVTHSPRLGEIA